MLTLFSTASESLVIFCKVLNKVFDVMASGENVAQPTMKVTEIVLQTGVTLPEALVRDLAKSMEICTPWLRYFISYDPSADISAAKCPVMAVNGDKDMQVSASENLPSTQSAGFICNSKSRGCPMPIRIRR